MQDTAMPKRCCLESCMQRGEDEDLKWDGWMMWPWTWERWV
jgi:hypothetical protein